MQITFRCRIISLFAVLFLVTGVNAEDWRAEGVGRVVAIADVHGAYEAMVETLINAGILDDGLAWVGGDAHLVIVGDLLDRGPRSRDVLDLLMRIEGEATVAGGKLHVLFGNHEMMNMIGDLRYVSKAEYGAFADDETPAQRRRWYKAWARRTGSSTTTVPERFSSEFPKGFFALQAAFSPNGVYGRWLLEKNIIAVVNGTAFVHGGLPPIVAEVGLEGVNRGLKQDLIDYVKSVATLVEAEVILPTDSFYDHEKIVTSFRPSQKTSQEVLAAIDVVKRLVDATVLNLDGPLWYRGNIACNGIIEEHRLQASLNAIGAERVVVGHTPTPQRTVLQRFDGRLIEVDTGMLNSYYKGNGSALVVENDELSVFSQSGAEPYSPIPHPRRVGRRPGGLSADALLVLLETGEIVSKKKNRRSGRTVVRVSDSTHTVSALFSKRRGQGFYPDVAAYRLDRLLDLDMVPVTAIRTVDNTEGSLQFLPEKTDDESKRSSKRRGSGAPCALPLQWAAMYVFDILTYNEGRDLKNMIYETSTWSLILIEYEDAFKNAKGRPPHLAKAAINVSEGWHAALTDLDDAVLAEQLGDVLDPRRLKALGERRDQLLAE